MKKFLVLVLAMAFLCCNAFAQVNLTMTSWRTDDKALWDQINAARSATTSPWNSCRDRYEYDGVLQTKLAGQCRRTIMFLRASGPAVRSSTPGMYPLSVDEIPNLANMGGATANPWTTEEACYTVCPARYVAACFFCNRPSLRTAA